MNIRVVSLLAGVLCVLPVCADSLRLSENGAARATIVIAEKATRAATFGAKDLKLHLDKMTGADFKIVTDAQFSTLNPQLSTRILVGPTKFTKTDLASLAGQQYVVDVRADAVELVGRDAVDFGSGLPGLYDEQGSMYAVYEFLEKNCGVTWVDASDYGTLVPDRKTLDVAVGRRQYEPFMAYRGGTISYNADPTYWKKSDPQWKTYHAAAFKDPSKAPAAHRLFLARSRAGGIDASANHSFYWWYDRFWNEKSKRFVRKRPDCFAKGYSGEPPQMCYLNPELIEQTLVDIRAYLDNGGYTNTYRNVSGKGPTWGKNRYCLEPMDNSSFCKCPVCAPYYEPSRAKDNSMHSTYWFTFVKKVAEEIKTSHPTAKISTLAYMSHEGLPKDVILPDNVEVYFCVSCNRGNPTSKACQAQLARMREWHEAYPKMKLGLWLYDTFPVEFAHNGNFQCVPGYFAHENAKQFRFFKEMNAAVGVFHCGFNGEVCQFMTLALMREPDLDADVLLDRFFAQYGAAAKPLRAFYDLVEKRWCDQTLRSPGMSYTKVPFHWQVCCPPEIMEKLAGYVDEAKRLAITPEEKARVKIFEIGQWKWMKLGADTYAERMRLPMPEWKAVRIAAADGDVDTVDWTKVPCLTLPIYDRGSETERADILRFASRLAHDGEWLYVELTQERDLSKMQVSGTIVPCDDWELYVARQRAQPYRCYFANASNLLNAASWGEVNWRQNVPSRETCGDKAYFARTKAVVDTANSRWIQRFALPLDRFLDGPVKPGDTFYLNPVTVLNSSVGKGSGPFRILTPVTQATVHTIDRSASVTLEKISQRRET